MAGFDAPAISAVISAATAAGLVTVASTTGFYVSQIGWINKSGGASTKVKIMKIVSTTTMDVQIVKDYEGLEANSAIPNQPSAGLGAPFLDNRLKPARYDYSDVSAYGDGTWSIYCDQQLIYGTDLTQTF